MEEKTQLSGEFNQVSGDQGEFNGSYRDLEFAPDPGNASTETKKNKHSRSLLLQASMVALGVVLISSSFGIDILGKKDVAQESIQDTEVVYELYIKNYKDEMEYGVEDFGELGEGVEYDPLTNTLFLRDCDLGIISYHHMTRNGSDFTIHIDGHVTVYGIEAFGDNVIINGGKDSVLVVSPFREGFYTDFGILIENGVLQVGPDVTVEVTGGTHALELNHVEADPGIVFDSNLTSVTGTIVSGQFFYRGDIEDYVDASEPDWTVIDENGNMATYVVFAPK